LNWGRMRKSKFKLRRRNFNLYNSLIAIGLKI